MANDGLRFPSKGDSPASAAVIIRFSETCDFGTGRAFSWVDTSNKGSIEAIKRIWMFG